MVATDVVGALVVVGGAVVGALVVICGVVVGALVVVGTGFALGGANSHASNKRNSTSSTDTKPFPLLPR